MHMGPHILYLMKPTCPDLEFTLPNWDLVSDCSFVS